MALDRENLAPTTHSLTPSPSNRPLIFWILTPRKKPEATGSAGRCEPGVGRFTDPHPLTCSFFTPSLHCLMFRQCRLPQPFSNPPFEWRIISFSIEAISNFNALPLQARLGLLFLFLPFFCLPVLSPAWMGLVFSHPGSPLFWIRSQLAHTAPTGPVWGFPGVVSLAGPQNRTQATQGRVWFFSPKRVYPSP